MIAQILVVEDTPANMKLATMLLIKAGYEVLQAVNAADAIALAQERIPDLILMDIQLPGMDGLTATRLLKETIATRHIPIVALTAFAMKGDEEKIMAAGCDGYIAKPIQYHQFLAEVGRQLAASSQAPGLITSKKKILITDDDPRNRKLEETLLLANGYDVRSVDSGQAALDAIAADAPDLILLDLMMPYMDGFEVVRRLKADPSKSHIPIIMVTALDDDGSRARLAAAGISDVITKPFDRWALQACIEKHLGDTHGNN